MRGLVNLLGIILLCVVDGASAQVKDTGEVPFGNQVNTSIVNYNRLRHDIATSGALEAGAVEQLVKGGFKTVLDLRTSAEGTAQERVSVEAAGMRYLNISIGRELPSQQDLADFREILTDPGRGPLLVHCQSANRVGTLWAMHQIEQGESVDNAIAEGRAIGMSTERENQLRDRL